MKLRVTIAASGQGRWSEELEFPNDCRASGFTPVLIVLDPTENPKLKELENAFYTQQGEVYIGEKAWRHLLRTAGPTMGQFIQKYVRTPIEALLKDGTDPILPSMTLSMKPGEIVIRLDNETLSIQRTTTNIIASEPDELPEDVGDDLPV